MTREIVDLIDHACLDWETSIDAMRWTPDPPAAPELVPWSTAPARQDRINECVFVGGPMHGRRRAVERQDGGLPYQFRVPIVERIDITSIEDAYASYVPNFSFVTYNLRWYQAIVPGLEDGQRRPAYCAPGATGLDLMNALRTP